MRDDDRPGPPTAVSPQAEHRLAVAETHLRALENLAEEVRAHRHALVPADGPASWRSDAAGNYAARLVNLRDWFQGAADEVEQAEAALAARVAHLRRAVAGAGSGAVA